MNLVRRTEPVSAPSAPPADTSLAKWRHLTECLIFAAPYGTTEYLRHLDATGRPYNRDQAIRRCRDLAEAITTDYPFPFKLQSCHAANDDPAFRLRYSHLLPKRPTTLSRAERRTGISDAQRQSEADELAGML